MTITLTDGGIETRIIYEFKHAIGDFELLEDEPDVISFGTHAQTALRALHAARPDLVTRVRGLKANASPLSPDELDKLDRLAATDYQTWGAG